MQAISNSVVMKLIDFRVTLLKKRDPGADKLARCIEECDCVKNHHKGQKDCETVFHLLVDGLIYRDVALHYNRDRLGRIRVLTVITRLLKLIAWLTCQWTWFLYSKIVIVLTP
jgi:hypothetical protein